jgi:hypothetical protein
MFPDRHFTNDDEFQAAIESMDTVEEHEVVVGGHASEHYKGLRYARAGWEASVVGKDYAVVQHPDVLRELHGGLRHLVIRPAGRIAETHRGQLTATLHFFNPHFDIARMVGATDGDTSCYLGIAVATTHGAPASCLALDAMAECLDGTQYVVSDVLGSRRLRHVGQLRGKLQSLVSDMVLRLPDLGAHIANAKATSLEPVQAEWVLRALRFGPRAREAILARGVASAWQLYDEVCRHAQRLEVRSTTRMSELRNAQAILDPHRLHTLLDNGHQMELDEMAKSETEAQPEAAEAVA